MTQTEDGASLQGEVESVLTFVYGLCGVFTFDFEVVSSKTVGLEVEGQRRVGLIQEQVDPGQLNAVPLKHWTQNLSGDIQIKKEAVNYDSYQTFAINCMWPLLLLCHLRVFFFIAGTISVFMSTLRSNLRLKHSLLGSCRGGNKHTVSLHRWGCSSAGPPRACAVCVLSADPQGGSFSLHCLTQTKSRYHYVISSLQRIMVAAAVLHNSLLVSYTFV